MALFGSKRDAKFIAAINSELLNEIVDTEIELYKLKIEESNSNIYGESENKTYYESILIPCMVQKEQKNANQDDYGYTYERSAEFAISRDVLESAEYYPEAGDIILWDNEYYEVDNVDANQYFAGKNPQTWPGGQTHGYSVSFVVQAHVTRQTPTGINKARFGSDNNEEPFKGF